MYQELIRGELTEAAATLDNFLKDENNIDAIRRACLLYTSDAADDLQPV